MADSRRGYRWLAAVFFVAIGLLLVYFVAAMVTGVPDAYYRRYGLVRSSAAPDRPPDQRRIDLKRGRPRIVGKVRLTYEGIARGSVQIAMVVLDLDPDYAYRHVIPLADAKAGFWLHDRRYRVRSLNRAHLRLEALPR